MLHEKSNGILCSLYKSARFTVQAIQFKESRKYTSLQKELLKVADLEHRIIIDTAMKLKAGENVDL